MNSKERLTRRWHCLKRRVRSAKPYLIACCTCTLGCTFTCALRKHKDVPPVAVSLKFTLLYLPFFISLYTSDPYSSQDSRCTLDAAQSSEHSSMLHTAQYNRSVFHFLHVAIIHTLFLRSPELWISATFCNGPFILSAMALVKLMHRLRGSSGILLSCTASQLYLNTIQSCHWAGTLRYKG